MLTLLRYLLTCILVTVLSGSHMAFIEPVQSVSFTEQHEKTETENFVDEAIPSARAKKQITKANSTVSSATPDFTVSSTYTTRAFRPIQEANLFLRYRKLII